MRPLLLVILVSLSGCSGAPAPPTHADALLLSDPGALGLAASTVTWDSGDMTADAAALMHLHLASASTCTFHTTLASRSPNASGPYQFVAVQFAPSSIAGPAPRVVAWSSTHAPATWHAVGIVDSRATSSNADGVSLLDLSFTAPSVGSDVVVTIAALAAVPHQVNGTRMGGMHLDVTCGQPIVVDRLGVGHDVHLFDQTSLAGGVAVSLSDPISVSLAAEDGLSVRFANSNVMLFADSGEGAGLLRLAGPDGTDVFSFPSLAAAQATHGPGDYDLHLTRTGAGFVDGFVGLLAGVEPVASLPG
ncbi:MAG: hypothetical protein V4510_06390 [bacterium]